MVENNADSLQVSEELFIKGWQCYQGLNQMPDHAQAFECWHQAAANNDALAMYNLACLYMHGHGVAADHGKGLEFLEKAAALGNIRAQDALRDIKKVGQSHFKPADKDIDFKKRRLYIIIGLIVLFLLVAVTIITIPNQFTMGR